MVHKVGFERGYAVGIINIRTAGTRDSEKVDIPDMTHLHGPSIVSRLRLKLHVS